MSSEMKRSNCWEYTSCGREPGGVKVAELGLCPAATENRLHGVNSGENGGRSCWALTGTLCDDRVQGTFASKLGNCRNCDFFKLVQLEEGDTYHGTKAILRRLSNNDQGRRK